MRGAQATALGFAARFGARLLYLFVAGRLFGVTAFGAYVLAVALVEVAVSVGNLGTKKILFQLLDCGMIPIVTHPERNARLRVKITDIARWVEAGCYVQVTAGACTGRFGEEARACAHALVERGLVHFIASDAHDCGRRSPSLREAYDTLLKKWTEERIRPLFVENPQAVLTGHPIDIDISLASFKRRKWYQFWG